MRQLAALLALALAGCAPRTYPECVRALEEAPGNQVRWVRLHGGYYGAAPEYLKTMQEWAACCDLPGVYPEDDGLCANARSVDREVKARAASIH